MPDDDRYWSQSRVLWTVFAVVCLLTTAGVFAVKLIFMFLRSQRGF